MYRELGDRRPKTHAQWVKVLGEGYGMPAELLSRLLPGAPELLMVPRDAGWRSQAFKPWRMAGASPYPAGVFVFHSLSPLGDTAFLLASLGQARRLACLLGRPLTIALADLDISKYNRMVLLFGAERLAENRDWRVGIYAAIGARTELATLDNLPGVPASKLWERARWVHTCDGRNESEAGGDRRGCGEEHVREELFKGLSAHFRATDEGTAFYFLVQRQHQHRYAHHLKLGNPSERHFDEPAHALDVVEHGAPSGVRHAVYVSDYVMGQSYRSAVSLHAYCFPSGTAFARSRSVEYCRSIALHLSDFADPRRVETAFSSLRPPHEERFIADLLSFVHFTAVTNAQPPPRDVRAALAAVTAEWAESWDHYCVGAESFAERVRQWFEGIEAGRSGGPPAPYYVFPSLLDTEHRQRMLGVLLAVARWVLPLLSSAVRQPLA